MKTITKKLRGLVFCLVFFAALTLAGRVEAQAADTISMTIERFSIGGGFIMEPKIVKIKPGDTYAILIQRVLREDVKKNYTYTGTDNDFYLSGIAGYDMTPHFPDCVNKILLDYNVNYVMPDATEGYLSEHDYSIGTGWMYYVNDEWQDGMSLVKPQNGDVCRLMYTAFYGVDIEGKANPSMDTPGVDLHSKTYYKVAKKQDLVRKMAAMNEDKSSWSSNANMVSAYDHAVDVMAAFDASQNDVTEALAMLNGSGSSSGGSTGGNSGGGSGSGSDPGTSPESGLTSVTLNKTTMSMKVGDISSLVYTLSPSSAAATVSWSSSDPGVVTVEGFATGALVTAKAAGTAAITATAVSGSQTKTASCTVTVAGEASDEEFTKGAPKVSVTGKTASSVSISWEAYPGAEKYNVLRKKTGETFVTLATVGADTTTYTDSGVQPNTNYSYTVEAVKGGLTSGRDTNCFVTTPKADEEKPAEAKPGRASIKSVTSAAYNKLKITWGKVDGAAGYYVLRSTSKNGSYKTAGTVSTTSYTDSGLTAGKTYYYKVQAYNDGEKGALSAAKSGKPVPAAPKVTVTAGKKQATVKWNKISGASGYVVYRSTSRSKGYKAVKTVAKGSTVSYKNTKLASKKTWYYKVRAYRTVSGKKVYSAYSSVVSAKIK